MPGILLSILHLLTHSILITTLWGREYYYLHLQQRNGSTDEGYTANKRQNWDVNPGNLAPEPVLLKIMCHATVLPKTDGYRHPVWNGYRHCVWKMLIALLKRLLINNYNTDEQWSVAVVVTDSPLRSQGRIYLFEKSKDIEGVHFYVGIEGWGYIRFMTVENPIMCVFMCL